MTSTESPRLQASIVISFLILRKYSLWYLLAIWFLVSLAFLYLEVLGSCTVEA